MKQFGGHHKADKVMADARAAGWEVNAAEFEHAGSDWIYLRDDEKRRLRIAFNTTNGHFYAYITGSVRPIATHMTEDLDAVEWYEELLDLFYKPLEGEPI